MITFVLIALVLALAFVVLMNMLLREELDHIHRELAWTRQELSRERLKPPTVIVRGTPQLRRVK